MHVSMIHVHTYMRVYVSRIGTEVCKNDIVGERVLVMTALPMNVCMTHVHTYVCVRACMYLEWGGRCVKTKLCVYMYASVDVSHCKCWCTQRDINGNISIALIDVLHLVNTIYFVPLDLLIGSISFV